MRLLKLSPEQASVCFKGLLNGPMGQGHNLASLEEAKPIKDMIKAKTTRTESDKAGIFNVAFQGMTLKLDEHQHTWLQKYWEKTAGWEGDRQGDVALEVKEQIKQARFVDNAPGTGKKKKGKNKKGRK